MKSADREPAGAGTLHEQRGMTLEALELDQFDLGLLSLTRHFLSTFATPAVQSWGHAYSIAVERWGETVGLSVAHALQKVLRAVLEARENPVTHHDPFSPEARLYATSDEESLLRMLRNMRRDETAKARDAVEELTGGVMDPHVIRAGLAFATRFSDGYQRTNPSQARPALRVIK
ncbi:MAG: hypothetical protein AAF771_08500 [Pseudomonadota bacterium]